MAPFYTHDPDDELLAAAGPGYVYLELPEYLLDRLSREGLDVSRGMIGPPHQIERSKAEVAKHDDCYTPENISETLDLLARSTWKRELPTRELMEATRKLAHAPGADYSPEECREAAAYHYYHAMYSALCANFSEESAMRLLHKAQGAEHEEEIFEEEEIDLELFEEEPAVEVPWYLLSSWLRLGYREGWRMAEAFGTKSKRGLAPHYIRRVIKRGEQP
ncbi:hypothetical protein IQ216_07210 [Cyanobium sp. LEGE 06143]|uniref:hypothetical protein n=1 Tax=Cyanobium sp. LEGE 06143 TaxID=945727 RepID=UPI00188018FF|nr:hypothetical protein [Cyanobium sp. LEGE 06143]MBE9172876.1 hypothetical protein [Cyanobium sp. LEGE 06143]